MRLGQWLAHVSPEMRSLPVDLPDGTTLVVDLRRIDEQPIFLDGFVHWEQDELFLVSHLVQLGDCVIDVGAHIGLYSRTLARAVGPAGIVVAYEPNPSSLLRNVEEFPQVLVRTLAVGNTEGPVQFLPERAGSLSRVVTEEADMKRRGVRRVNCVSIDKEIDRLRLPPVSLIKIDVEGGEEFVLQGAASVLRGGNPPTILFEWIPTFQDRHRGGAFDVLRALGENKWRFWRIGWGQPIAEIHEWNFLREPANVLAVPEKRLPTAESALRVLSARVGR